LVFSCALYFIFPGSFQPFAIPHNDIYMPLTIANAPFNRHMPRPTGNLIDFLRGAFGLRFSIFFPVAVTLMNCIGTFLLSIKLLPNVFSTSTKNYQIFVSFSLYMWLICTHRYFYIFSGWDAYAQYSYLLLLCAAACLVFFRNNWLKVAGLFLFSLASFLAKETYVLSFLFLIPFIFWLGRAASEEGCSFSSDRSMRVNPQLLAVWLAGVIAFVIAYAINLSLNSPFTGSGLGEADPYKVALSPISVLREWSRYAQDGWNFPIVVIVGVIYFWGIRKYWKKGNSAVVLVPFFAGVLAWLPNSALPNHYFEQYSFTGSYLYYLPIVFVVCRSFNFSGARAGALPSMVMCGALCILPFINAGLYKKDSVQFYVLQMKKQEKYLKVFDEIASSSKGTSDSRPQLLVGIAPPFNPFDYPSAFLTHFFPNGLKLDVVGYSSIMRKSIEATKDGLRIRRVDVADVDLSSYSKVWVVALDGSQMQLPSEESLSIVARRSGLTRRDIVLYPEMVKIFSGQEAISEKEFINCGQVLQQYGAVEKSLLCYLEGMEKFPNNPYPYFFYALAVESTGDVKKAILYMKKAVEAKDQGAGNPAFTKELGRLEGRKSAL
jgi:tetratricopeptide (TPR) repeat protein